MSLTWGLVIATKDRLLPLTSCVRFAVDQSHPPAEIVIVDASADWQDNREAIAALLTDRPDIRFVYEAAPKPSSAAQRNLGIERARADIVFMIDDDSYLFPDAAERIMAHYEADSQGSLAGIALRPAANAPGDSSPALPGARPLFVRLRDLLRSTDTDRSLLGRARNRVAWRLDRYWRKMTSTGTGQWFVPYDGDYPKTPSAPHLTARALQPARLFEGYRMTFRRERLATCKFDPLLLYYCPGEDLDLSYRLSRENGLMRATDAWVYHFQSSSGRLKHEQVALLGTLNRALFLRRNAPDQSWARTTFRRQTLHRTATGAIRDMREGLWHLPRARGTWTGRRVSQRIFEASMDDIEAFYPGLQTRIVRGEPLS